MRHTVDTLNAIGVNCGFITVTLNGEPIDCVIAFDEEMGVIERYMKDHEGKVLVRENEFVTERLEGEVSAYLTRRKSDNKWMHALPEPAVDALPKLHALIPSADITPADRRITAVWCQEHPHEAAAVIEQQRERLSQLLKINRMMRLGHPAQGDHLADDQSLWFSGGHTAVTMILTREEAEARFGPDPVGRTVTIDVVTGPHPQKHRFAGVPVEQEGDLIVVRAHQRHYVFTQASPTEQPETKDQPGFVEYRVGC